MLDLSSFASPAWSSLAPPVLLRGAAPDFTFSLAFFCTLVMTPECFDWLIRDSDTPTKI